MALSQPSSHSCLISTIEARKKRRQCPGRPFGITWEAAPNVLFCINLQGRVRVTTGVKFRIGAVVEKLRTLTLNGLSKYRAGNILTIELSVHRDSRSGTVFSSINFSTAADGIRIARPQRTKGKFFLRNNHARIVAGFNPSRSAVSGTESNRCISSTSEHDHPLRILGI
jgi:hypothetical protein